MALRLRGATSGYIELKAPASAGDNTLTLPVNNGSANQLLKTDGSGNLSWVDDNSGVSLSGSTNNTIATVTGANALQGEANLTFDGTTLKVAGGSNTTQAVFSGTGGSGARGLEIVTESVGAADEGVIFNARASGTTGRLTFKTNSATAMTILGNGGNIGIGTIAPTKLLHLSGGSSPTLKISASDATPGIFIADSDRTSQDQHLGEFQALWNGNLAGRIVVVAGPDTANKDDGHMDFYTSNGGSNGHRMRIKHDGKIGIGTTAPPDKLNVVGAVRINQSTALDHLCNAGTMLEVRGDGIGSGVVDYDFFKGFKIALNDGTEYGGQAQFAVGRWEENGTNARSSLMISLGHGAQSSVSNADTDILLLTSDGQVEIEDGNLKIGTAGHGIDFSAVTPSGGSVDSNILADYEVGEFTPTWYTQSSLITVDYHTQKGFYVKIGRMVYFQVYIRINSRTGGSGNLIVNDLPFTPQDATTHPNVAYGGLNIAYTNAWVGDSVDRGLVSSSSAIAYIYVGQSSGTNVNAGAGNLGNGTQFRAYGSYVAA